MSRRSTALQSVAKRARKKGISAQSKPAALCATCPQADKPGGKTSSDTAGQQPPENYEECYLKELVVEIDNGTKAHSFAVSSKRRTEPVDPTAFKEYHSALTDHELVIETLSAVNLGARGKHLRVKSQAFNAAHHSSFQPLHPHAEIGSHAQTDGGNQALSQIFAPERTWGQSWAAIWPFRGERTQRISVKGTACGHAMVACNQPAIPALRELAMRLVVIPEEEWTFKIKDLKNAHSFKASGEANKDYAKRGNREKASETTKSDPFGTKSVTTKIERGKNASSVTRTADKGDYSSFTQSDKKQDSSGSSYSGTTDSKSKTEKVSDTDKEGYGETYSEKTSGENVEISQSLSEKKELKVFDEPIASRTFKVSQKGLNAPIKEEVRYGISEKISLELKSAGETATFEPGKFVESLYAIKEIFDDIGKALSSFRAGGGLSCKLTVLHGQLNASWGYRWPSKYQENSRVYYVERFIKFGGDLTVVEGTLGAWGGIDFDSGWLPVGIAAIVEISITVGLHIAPNCSLVYTNPSTGKGTDAGFEIEGAFSIVPKGSGNGSARVMGFRRQFYCQLDGTFKASAKFAVSFATSPSLKASVLFDGLWLTGYFYNSSRIPPRQPIEPRKLAEKREIMKEREFWS